MTGGFWFLPVDLDAKIESKTQKPGEFSNRKSYPKFMAFAFKVLVRRSPLGEMDLFLASRQFLKAQKFLKFVELFSSWCTYFFTSEAFFCLKAE